MTILVKVIDAETMFAECPEMERVLWSMETTGKKSNALETVKFFMNESIRKAFVNLAEVLECKHFDFAMQRLTVTAYHETMSVNYYVKERV